MKGFYNHYDDGKVKKSRQMKVEIVDVEDKNILTEEDWQDIKDCSFLYNQEQDVVLVGKLHLSENKIEYVKYVKTIDDRWFSLHFWGGLLDIDNSYTDNLKEYYSEIGVILEEDYYDV